MKFCYVLLLAVMVSSAMTGCRKTAAESEVAGKDGGAVVRTVIGEDEGWNWVDLDMSGSSHPTRTAIIWNPSATVHKVNWSIGDRVYSYAEGGAYMSDVLTAAKLADADHGAKFEIAYHEGDVWFVAYCHGSLIGERKGKYNGGVLTIEDGIPHLQNGSFKDLHICLGKGLPETDTLKFWNVQSFIRFRIEGSELDTSGNPKGTIDGAKVKKIKLSNLTPEILAGNMEINIEGKRYAIKYRSPLDSTIIVEPDGSGYFEPATDYYVAVPVRSYKMGVNLNLYDAAGIRMGYIKIPGTTVTYSSIVNADDLLKYLVFTAQNVVIKYADDVIASKYPEVKNKTIKVVEGHTAEILSEVLPSVTTNKTLSWTTSKPDVVKVSNTGDVTGLKAGDSAVITAKTLDGSNIELSFTVEVTEKTGLSLGDYNKGDYAW